MVERSNAMRKTALSLSPLYSVKRDACEKGDSDLRIAGDRVSRVLATGKSLISLEYQTA